MRSSTTKTWSRRSLLLAGAGAALAGGSAVSGVHAAERRDGVVGALRALERRHGARLGVFAWNTVSGRTVRHRAGERFPICSVAKTPAVAAVLRDLDRDGSFLAKVVRYGAEDIERSGYAPVTGLPENLAGGMTVADLCAATITHSDNTAMNLLVRELGGPAAVTCFCRSLGDDVTRLDRWEPELNSAEPGRVTDTTSPLAIGKTYARLVLTRALAPADRERLTGWLLANTTGDNRIRAGLPEGWTVAEKTGTGEYGTTNDVGVAWTPKGEPVVLAVLSTRPDPEAPADEPLLARAAALTAAAVG
ncbi:class A beta-lactamase [Streptomyces sp. YS415]|uniref:class A beta-lactamase n=1 Tax=Streptomyces sp. YS415 TaxID=2944806 RepID=UPI002020A2EA|nr:class A beta-lactamase [Streptomyces sp. YS415]MCL7429381.1 class A beta-lactamase [Streptomyces sp. YS415]